MAPCIHSHKYFTQKDTGLPSSRVSAYHCASIGGDGCSLEIDNSANSFTVCLLAVPSTERVYVSLQLPASMFSFNYTVASQQQ